MNRDSDVFRKIRIRFTLAFTLLGGLFVLVIFSLVCGITLLNTAERINSELEKTVAEYSRMQTDAAFDRNDNSRCAVIIYYEGTVFTHRLDNYSDEVKEEIIAAVIANKTAFSAGEYRFKARGGTYRNGNGMVYAIYDCTADLQIYDIQVFISVLSVIGSLFAIMIIGWVISSYNIRPLNEAFGKQKELIANASHELKTPLAIIAANVGAMRASPETTIEENSKWLDNVEAQIARMDALIKDMLELSRLEYDRESPMEIIDLSGTVNCAVLSMEATCFEKNVTLTNKIYNGISLRCCKAEIERLVVILLDNALKYTPSGGEVTVKLYMAKTPVLSVRNTGSGISPDRLDKVFDRFYKEDDSRKGDGSFGLGLAIAKTTVEKQGGRISCNSDGSTFTEFTVIF